jgi:hypothetical protein
MSGGYFDYRQYQCEEMADRVERLIASNGKPNEWGDVRNYPEDILARFQMTVDALRRVEAMLTRVDWLVSGDDGEDSFRRRWAEDVGEDAITGTGAGGGGLAYDQDRQNAITEAGVVGGGWILTPQSKPAP